MIFRTPSYLNSFRCSADKCSDNCCIGWEIDIDESTAEIYKKAGGSFGERLRKNISFGECASFILAGERCPFLNESNLCDIIINLGEDKLCQICSDHPRYFEWYGELKEGGAGLCCEEAAKLILTAENPLAFTEREIPFEEGDEFEEALFTQLFEAREKIFSILYNENKSIKERVQEMLDFSEMLQVYVDNYIEGLPEIKKTETGEKGDMPSLLESLRALEPIDSGWETYLEELISSYEEPDKKSDLSLYQRNLLIYYIYRYFLKGVFDGEILSKVKLAAISTAVISYIIRKEGESLPEAVEGARVWSKQVEYSQENLDLLCEMTYDKSFLTSGSIKSLY